ncbi:MAG: RNA polymerase sigma factor [Ignavibacteriales bacterium]|nr:RNA polymerase sigma factor [Ignavibacteriales bacterium]
MAPTDSELIEQSKAGNVTAFEQLIFRYDKDVLNIASQYTQSSDDAKDIYQETFIRVFKGLPKFQQRSEFATWVFRIATNVCLTHKEKKKKMSHVSLYDEGDDDIPKEFVVSDESADSLTHGGEISSRIGSALQSLSPQQRLVFTLRHYQDYKLKDIAVMMECAEGTVKKYLFEATQKMRTHLHDLYE